MASGNTASFTEHNFETAVLKSPVPVLVDFWAEWCGPCKMIGPIVDELANDYAGKATIGKVDIEASQNLAVQYGITSIPTLLLFKNGQIVDQLRGLRSKRDLRDALDRAIA